MSRELINVLMSGAGAPGAAGILKCLQQDKSVHVICADADPDATGKYLANDFVSIPAAGNSDFTDTVLSICRKKNIHVLMPLVTKELIPLSQHIKEFELAGTKLLVSSTASLEIANNKSRLYEFLQWRGLKIPNFRVVENVEQFQNAVAELGHPSKQVCFKPSVSNGSRGFRIISDQFNEADILFNQKPNNVFIRLNDVLRVLSSAPFPELLVSQYLPGDEFSVDCLCNHGKALLVLPRLRKKMVNGISVKGEFVKKDQIIDYCTRLIKELQLHGNIGIQVKADEEGEFLVLEINPRVQGTISAALGAGVNLPLLAVKQELGLPIMPDELFVKWGVRFSRYWEEVFY